MQLLKCFRIRFTQKSRPFHHQQAVAPLLWSSIWGHSLLRFIQKDCLESNQRLSLLTFFFLYLIPELTHYQHYQQRLEIYHVQEHWIFVLIRYCAHIFDEYCFLTFYVFFKSLSSDIHLLLINGLHTCAFSQFSAQGISCWGM